MTTIPNGSDSVPQLQQRPNGFTPGNVGATGSGARRINPSFEQATVPNQRIPDIQAFLQATYGPNMTKQQLFEQLRQAAMGNG